jgi:thiol-disulfide isomerase/thioredoxin
VEDGAAIFKGEIDEPIAARLIIDSDRYAQFILEPGSIVINPDRRAIGSPLNDLNESINDSVAAISAEYQAATTDEAKQAAYAKFNAFVNEKMLENIDNVVGYLFFIQQAYEMTSEEFTEFLAKYPDLAKYKRVSKLLAMNERKSATSVGNKYADFEADGHKLSEYVGRDGKFLLVDFWASWCGPCRRQLPVIKEIYNKYKDTKLNVLGVAVWDEPDDTRRAIKEHELTWECLIGAGSVPTDIYGISGIPCIMLISPDGTILARDLQGDELKAAVDANLQ